MRFPQERNDHLVNLLTIARFDPSSENRAAVQEELLRGRALLIVQARPVPGDPRSLEFLHAPVLDGRPTLFAFTSEVALRSWSTQDMELVIVPAGAFFQGCLKNGIGTVVVDASTPNELRIALGRSAAA
ncbi:MAG: SseB family protein [Bacteroidetes bacterium]|jgi:hypothetical protein|nr:SseB family protein [Bacteroidota bacterium]MBX7130009.1 SseB family protein [Flavobacteriales bacterium]MCC6654434.1 SseB family protein [Flavobacteriales bacterium]HMU12797.1 SseB family protein [Flavobacteriales bacterium]HMW95768.1 SseB family protein [Flavobacteriales bacterium]